MIKRVLGKRAYAASHIRSPGFLHVDGVLQNPCSSNLIHHFTVIFAAHASFVQVSVRGYRAEALIHEVHGNVQPGAVQLLCKELGILRGHAGGRVFFALHGPREADENLHRAAVRRKGGNDPDVRVLFRIAVERFQGRGQDGVAVADGDADADSAHLYPPFDYPGGYLGRST